MAERDAATARSTRVGARRPGRVVQGEVVEAQEESHPNGAARPAAAGAAEGAGAGAAGDEAALAGEAQASAGTPRVSAQDAPAAAEGEAPQAEAPRAEAPQAAAGETREGSQSETPEGSDGEAPEAAEDSAGDTAAPDRQTDPAERPDAAQADAAEPTKAAEPTQAAEPTKAAESTDLVRRQSELVRAADAPPGFPTEESLAQQGEATTQLRRAIDELRQMLDVDAVPPMPAPTPRRRRPALLAVAAVAVLAVVVAAFVALRGSGDDDATGTARPAPSTPAPSASAPAVNLPMPYPPAPGTAPLSGPGVDEPGTLLVVRLEGDALAISEQAILPEPATSQIPLVVSDVARLGGDIAGLRPQVTDLRAALDRTPAPVRATGDGRWFVPLAGSPTRIAVSYRVTGAVLPTQPSENGRALVLVQPLLGRGLVPEQLPLVVRTTGMKGLGAACPDAPSALSLCGQGDGKGNWTATVPQSLNPTVVVQVDLPAGGAAP